MHSKGRVARLPSKLRLFAHDGLVLPLTGVCAIQSRRVFNKFKFEQSRFDAYILKCDPTIWNPNQDFMK